MTRRIVPEPETKPMRATHTCTEIAAAERAAAGQGASGACIRTAVLLHTAGMYVCTVVGTACPYRG